MFDNVGHWPEIRDSRKMCKKTGCSGKTNVCCSKCDINLCLNSTNNCFKNFIASEVIIFKTTILTEMIEMIVI